MQLTDTDLQIIVNALNAMYKGNADPNHRAQIAETKQKLIDEMARRCAVTFKS